MLREHTRGLEIAPATGDVAFTRLGLRVGPKTTRRQFLRTAAGKRARVLVRNEPYCSFALRSFRVSGAPFTCSLWFNGAKLWKVELTDVSPEFPDWPFTEDGERARQAKHERWIEKWFPAGRRYAWGVIAIAPYDFTRGLSSSAIGILYDKRRVRSGRPFEKQSQLFEEALVQVRKSRSRRR